MTREDELENEDFVRIVNGSAESKQSKTLAIIKTDIFPTCFLRYNSVVRKEKFYWLVLVVQHGAPNFNDNK